MTMHDTATRRLTIDTARCSGHGRCYTLAPDFFDPDEEGFPVLLADTITDDSPHMPDVRAAVDGCPERAISMELEA